jgi:hypothetical protein
MYGTDDAFEKLNKNKNASLVAPIENKSDQTEKSITKDPTHAKMILAELQAAIKNGPQDFIYNASNHGITTNEQLLNLVWLAENGNFKNSRTAGAKVDKLLTSMFDKADAFDKLAADRKGKLSDFLGVEASASTLVEDASTNSTAQAAKPSASPSESNPNASSTALAATPSASSLVVNPNASITDITSLTTNSADKSKITTIVQGLSTNNNSSSLDGLLTTQTNPVSLTSSSANTGLDTIQTPNLFTLGASSNSSASMNYVDSLAGGRHEFGSPAPAQTFIDTRSLQQLHVNPADERRIFAPTQTEQVSPAKSEQNSGFGIRKFFGDLIDKIRFW